MSTTREIRSLTLRSRSGEPSAPRKYFEATMFVAVWLQVVGTSMPCCSKTGWPRLVIDDRGARLPGELVVGVAPLPGEVTPEAQARFVSRRRRLAGPRFGGSPRGGSTWGRALLLVVSLLVVSPAALDRATLLCSSSAGGISRNVSDYSPGQGLSREKRKMLWSAPDDQQYIGIQRVTDGGLREDRSPLPENAIPRGRGRLSEQWPSFICLTRK